MQPRIKIRCKNFFKRGTFHRILTIASFHKRDPNIYRAALENALIEKKTPILIGPARVRDNHKRPFDGKI